MTFTISAPNLAKHSSASNNGLWKRKGTLLATTLDQHLTKSCILIGATKSRQIFTHCYLCIYDFEEARFSKIWQSKRKADALPRNWHTALETTKRHTKHKIDVGK